MITIENVKEFWDRRPCNIKHSNKPIYTKEYYDEVEKRKYKVESHIPKFAEFSKWNGKDVLEIGCGIGTDSINFVRNGARLTVVELSKESMDITRKRFELYNLDKNVTFHIGNAENLTKFVIDKKFDLVYSFGVIHHTLNPKNIITEIKKVLKPEGELRIMLYSKWSTKNIMIKLGLAQPEAQVGCPIANTYDHNDIVELLEGYEIISEEKDHIFPYQIEPYKKYQYIYLWRYKYMPNFVFNWLEKKLGWHYLVIAKLKK